MFVSPQLALLLAHWTDGPAGRVARLGEGEWLHCASMFRDTQFIHRAGAASSGAGSLPADITELVLRRIFFLSAFTAFLAPGFDRRD